MSDYGGEMMRLSAVDFGVPQTPQTISRTTGKSPEYEKRVLEEMVSDGFIGKITIVFPRDKKQLNNDFADYYVGRALFNDYQKRKNMEPSLEEKYRIHSFADINFRSHKPFWELWVEGKKGFLIPGVIKTGLRGY